MKKSIWQGFISILLLVLLSACNGDGSAPEPEVELGFQPAIPIPIRVSINSRGELKVGLSGTLATPIGIFDIGGGMSIDAIRQGQSQPVLIVRVDGEAVVYELEQGKAFNVTFDDSDTLYRKVDLTYETNGDIVLELESVNQAIGPDPAGITNTEVPGFTQQNKVTTSLTTTKELNSVPSIWNINNIPALDLPSPGKRNYNVTVRPTDKLIWPYFWCTSTEEVLRNNLQYFDLEFLVDGEKIPNSQIYYYADSSSNWNCGNWVTTLSEWKSGEVIRLNIRYVFSSDVFDGYKTYPAGEYIFGLTVSVK